MKAEDLRPGNLVLLGGEITTVTVNNLQYHERFKPIGLTKEWLKQFEFTEVENWWYMYFNMKPNRHREYKNSLTVNLRDCETSVNSNMGVHEAIYVYCQHPQYVHQLQNLYFSITGTELPQLTIANTTEK